MTALDQYTDSHALAERLEYLDEHSWLVDSPDLQLPSDDELRDALERVHGMEHHPKREVVWNKAYERGHSDGCARIAREYAERAELLQ
ncbi:hypothetical protein [Deinococcus sp. Leaf326]|uniref:hypothetical protein n=1 Tax=Deinococcus sp. Leaf326 TaxID=1736338 RepID=UPI0006F3E281|nr:hypothetical protein [Deinococcus sp. Leaf326]KQR40764.1 hypothetical protein ASF71_00930 [Deinococcus sp. Leaf326]